MKTSTYKYLTLTGAFVLLVACSTKKNSFVNRNWHAVTTEYNVLYNGNLALDAGVEQLKTTYDDNFWELLPVERMQPVLPKQDDFAPAASAVPAGKTAAIPDNAKSGQKSKGDAKAEAFAASAASTSPAAGPDANIASGKNANFSRAEEKATKAIQMHSMNIGGHEKNPQMDEAHLLLGKARYYENRFIPSLEAFNYILYKYPNSDKIFTAKIWREKTNIRLNNEAIAIKNLKQLLKEKEMDAQTFADANAMLAQAYINTGSKDSAITVLRNAAQYTKEHEEEARYYFILGQLFEIENQPDSAFAQFQHVIDMKRKSPRRYVIQAQARQASQFDYKNGDTLVFMEKYRKLLEDRENRPYLDILNHQVGLFYDKQDIDGKAIEYYNRSLRKQTTDKYLTASNHRNIAEIYFKDARYVNAGMYYDSTMVYLDNRSREYNRIKKKRDNLADVIKYEGIAQTNDSILHIVSLNEAGRKAFFNDYIVKLKEQDEKERIRLEKEAIKAENMGKAANNMGNTGFGQPQLNAPGGKVTDQMNTGQSPRLSSKPGSPAGNTTGNPAAGNKFYFYTPATVSYGKLEFERKWGNRPLTDNWRWSKEIKLKEAGLDIPDDTTAVTKVDTNSDPRYMPDFYISQLPTSQVVIDSLAKERNFAYYQLGSIYKDKFKEYQRAADKLEKLLVSNPEERLILPSQYNLYKIYQIIDPAKAEVYKNKILAEYPDSRYAEIIRNPQSDNIRNASPEAMYDAVFKKYEDGDTREAYVIVDQNIDTYTGEEIVSKFELLKANITGRLKGVEEYKKALNFVALNYPNSEEGKRAEEMLKTDIPALEKLGFGTPAISWKIVFKFDDINDPKIKPLKEKIQHFIKESYNNSITLSEDIYTDSSNFLVIHGFNSKLAAEDAQTILQDYKTYKIAEPLYIMSSEDYKVIQIKKNFTEFLAIK